MHTHVRTHTHTHTHNRSVVAREKTNARSTVAVQQHKKKKTHAAKQSLSGTEKEKRTQHSRSAAAQGLIYQMLKSMSKNFSRTTLRVRTPVMLGFGRFAAAAVIYASFAVYLYQPYFKHFNVLQYLLVVNVCLASLGCFVLSRRWVSSFAGSFFAGAIYGFGPFALGLANFHPTAGLLAAIVPWLFCPAVFGPKAKLRWLRIPLSSLPFLAILLFFQISAHYRLFAIPMRARLHLADLAGLVVPLVMTDRSLTLVGFYHIPIAALIMGLSMLLAAQRFGIMILFAIGTVLAFCGSFFNVSPIIWLTIPILCCSVLIGVRRLDPFEELPYVSPTFPQKNAFFGTFAISPVSYRPTKFGSAVYCEAKQYA